MYFILLEHLPTISDCQKSVCPIMVADIMLTKGKINVNAFGFRRAGDRMALHDHPNIRGFIKCIRGSMKVFFLFNPGNFPFLRLGVLLHFRKIN